MPTELVENLVIVLAGAALINVVLAAALWRNTRDPLFRSLFIAWTATIASGLAQGALTRGELAITLGFSTVFLANAAFAQLLGAVTGVAVPWRALVAGLVAGLAASAGAFAARAPFWVIALPTALAVAAPVVAVSARVIRTRWRAMHVQGHALVASCLLFSAHNVDFAFLRARPSLAALGFTIATLVVFAISISAPAAVLEVVTERQARLAAQMEIARTLQASLVPPDARVDGLEFVAFMRPAESVGGDYLHRFRVGDVEWFFVGDVTGHGFGAGLFTLMAHSALASIVEARPEISPRDLNHVANRVLSATLERLQERRSMTIVAVRRDVRSGRVAVSGSHEDLLVYRAASAEVETIPMAHFPFGLGFTPDLAREAIGDAALELGPGDLLFVGTDGVFEAARAGDHTLGHFGAEPVAEELSRSRGVPLGDVRRRIVERLERFTEGRYDDDVAFAMLRSGGGTS